MDDLVIGARLLNAMLRVLPELKGVQFTSPQRDTATRSAFKLTKPVFSQCARPVGMEAVQNKMSSTMKNHLHMSECYLTWNPARVQEE